MKPRDGFAEKGTKWLEEKISISGLGLLEIPIAPSRRKKSKLLEASYSAEARANSELEKAIAKVERGVLAIDSSSSDSSSDSSNSDSSTYSTSSSSEASKRKRRK